MHVHVHGLAAPEAVSLLADGQTHSLEFSYDPQTETLHLAPLALEGAGAQLTIGGPALLARRNRAAETGLRLLRAFRLDSAVKNFIAERLEDLPGRPELLEDFGVDLTAGQTRALLEVSQGVGVEATRDDAGPLLLVWNNDERPGFGYRFVENRALKWFNRERHRSTRGDARRQTILRPEGDQWRLTADYFGLANLRLTSD